jgi:hypothetical protein
VLQVELFEKITCRNANLTERLRGILRGPLLEYFARFGKLLFVKIAEAGFQLWDRRKCGCGRRGALGSGTGSSEAAAQKNEDSEFGRTCHGVTLSSEQAGNKARFSGHSRAVLGVGEEHTFFCGQPLRKH